MTDEMLETARRNAKRVGAENITYLKGTIESIPLPDESVDVILSNCVINLSPDKPQVFREAFRVLKPGGRLAISDVVASVELPEEMRSDAFLVSACVGNAALADDLERWMVEAGFADQAHMIREIRMFAGRTPSRLVDEEKPYLTEMLDLRNFREIELPPADSGE
jgi:ubiquinone/menaquinone biosynthesis C-methylase UbiE